MSYKVEFAASADDDLAQLPPLIASAILDALDRLAQDPVTLGRPSYFPFLPGRQLFQFEVEADGDRRWVTAFFRFHQDERRIVIVDLFAQ